MLSRKTKTAHEYHNFRHRFFFVCRPASGGGVDFDDPLLRRPPNFFIKFLDVESSSYNIEWPLSIFVIYRYTQQILKGMKQPTRLNTAMKDSIFNIVAIIVEFEIIVI